MSTTSGMLPKVSCFWIELVLFNKNQILGFADCCVLLGFAAVSKKLKALMKNEKCGDLKPWLQSVINHLYWAAVSTPAGQGELIVAKWKSIERHIQNIHSGHGQLFPNCEHRQLRGRKARKKWIKPSELPGLMLYHIIMLLSSRNCSVNI